MSSVPAIRIRSCNDAPLRSSGGYVLYWMIASRRLHYNFALDRALEHCHGLSGKPLVIFEALRCGYQWACDRFHRFVIDGMTDNAAVCAKRGVLYIPYVEPAPGDGRGLLEALSADACVVVTDDFPSFFLPRMVAAAAKKLTVRLEAVDSNGLLPLRATGRTFSRAFDFRRFLQKSLQPYLLDMPSSDPLAKINLPAAKIPKSIVTRWPASSMPFLNASSLEQFPIDHKVKPVVYRGGHASAAKQFQYFLNKDFSSYANHRNEIEKDVSSGLSPYLHFGHISPHEVFAQITRREKWRPAKLAVRANGSREGWWNMSPQAEAFLDQLVTWRELGYNFGSHHLDAERYESLPDWSRDTLRQHEKDRREHLYTLDQFESAKTHDTLWNAAQTQLVREGRIHNYLRMLWGKKILGWTRTPRHAAKIMIHLNDKYAVDGRDPNSYSGIFWILGRYDRPWGPERPVFGLVRYMSSENAARKFSVRTYIRRYSSDVQTVLHPSKDSA
jgi:deoxyribodipyrimidine photo-lyase